jgi:hypothetical protein
MPTDTFNITAAGQDGSGSLSGGTYPSLASFSANDGNGSIFPGRGYNGSTTYFCDNALMYFDTSGLPDDATITAAELEIYVISLVDTDNLSVVGEYYAYDGSPTVSGDITLNEVGGAFAPVDITSIGIGVEVFTLTNVSNISLTGNTGFRLKVTQRAADAAPTGHNYIAIAEFEHASLAEPILRVTYTVDETEGPKLRVVRSNLRW